MSLYRQTRLAWKICQSRDHSPAIVSEKEQKGKALNLSFAYYLSNVNGSLREMLFGEKRILALFLNDTENIFSANDRVRLLKRL